MLKFLASLKSGAKRQRAPRDEIACTATLCAANAFHRVELRDVSKSGCKVYMSQPQRVGDTVQIALENFHSLGGTIRWYREGLAGIEFIRPISDSALAKWKSAVAGAERVEVVETEECKRRRNFWGEALGQG